LTVDDGIAQVADDLIAQGGGPFDQHVVNGAHSGVPSVNFSDSRDITALLRLEKVCRSIFGATSLG
jgi:hypothetical protein